MTKHFINLTHDMTTKLGKLPAGTLLELRIDSSIPGREIYGYALPGTLPLDPNWLIYADDQVGSSFHRQFAEVSGEPIADFVHQWSDRLNILPGVQFINEYSVQFTGAANSNATVPDSADIDFAATDGFSMSIWIKTDISSTDIFQKATSTGGNNGYTLYTDGSERVIFEFRESTGNRIRVRTDAFTTIDDGMWHHIMITKASGASTASTVKVYIDGVDQVLNVLNDTLTGTTTSASSLYIGSNIGGGARFNGNMDELSIWNAELTPAEVAEVYNNDNGVIDLQAGSGQIASALNAWWRFGDGSFVGVPTVPDEEGTNTMTLGSAVSSGDIETVVPP